MVYRVEPVNILHHSPSSWLLIFCADKSFRQTKSLYSCIDHSSPNFVVWCFCQWMCFPFDTSSSHCPGPGVYIDHIVIGRQQCWANIVQLNCYCRCCSCLLRGKLKMATQVVVAFISIKYCTQLTLIRFREPSSSLIWSFWHFLLLLFIQAGRRRLHEDGLLLSTRTIKGKRPGEGQYLLRKKGGRENI